MRIGLIGLGKMGYNLAINIKKHKFTIVAQDVNAESVEKIHTEEHINAVDSVEKLCSALGKERLVIWLMVPSGKIVDGVIESLIPHLSPNDIIIDGGNSHYKDSIKRYNHLKEHDICFLDCGTSGGTSGARDGVCAMVGGDAEVFNYVEPLFKAIAVKDGYLYCGAAGSGHFAKMVHNGIEYGMMQSIAEGFEVLERSKDAKLDAITGVMNSSGEGKWTLETALEMGVPTPVIALSLMMRYRSQFQDTFSGKVVAALRNEFGGHAVVKAKE